MQFRNIILSSALLASATAQVTDLTPSQSSAVISAVSSFAASLAADTNVISAIQAIETQPNAAASLASIFSAAQSFVLAPDAATNTAGASSLFAALGSLPSPANVVLQSAVSHELVVIGSILGTSFAIPTVGAATSPVTSDGSYPTHSSTPSYEGNSTATSSIVMVTTNAANGPAYVKAAGAALGVFGAAIAML